MKEVKKVRMICVYVTFSLPVTTGVSFDIYEVLT
jgi:hypothetical protein